MAGPLLPVPDGVSVEWELVEADLHLFLELDTWTLIVAESADSTKSEEVLTSSLNDVLWVRAPVVEVMSVDMWLQAVIASWFGLWLEIRFLTECFAIRAEDLQEVWVLSDSLFRLSRSFHKRVMDAVQDSLKRFVFEELLNLGLIVGGLILILDPLRKNAVVCLSHLLANLFGHKVLHGNSLLLHFLAGN